MPHASVRTDEVRAEAFAEDARQPQPERLRQLDRRGVFAIDQLAARFTVLAVDEPVANGVDTSADARAGVDEADVESACVQIACGGQTSESGANDDDGWRAGDGMSSRL